MRKIFKRKSRDIEPAPQQDILTLVNQLQQQLEAIGQKIDALISQNSQRPQQHFDRHRRHDRGDRGNNFRERNFTRVICADCGQECEVPFRPSADRPVYCKDCFAKRRNSSGSHDSRPRERDFSKGVDQQEESRGFGKKKKRGSFRRKERD